MTAIFLFHRSLRLPDNLGLTAAAKKYKVVPVFVFTPEQVTDNPYFSANSFQFMIESLKDLEAQIERHDGVLWKFRGETLEILETLIDKLSPEAIYFNKDYTPYARSRDAKIKKLCAKREIKFFSFRDYNLIGPEKIGKKGVYKVFSPFYRYANSLEYPKPLKVPKINFLKPEDIKLSGYPKHVKNPDIAESGGRTNGLRRLERIKKFSDYGKTRDYPENSTTMLSAHIKFGTVSIREIYWKIVDTLGSDSPLLRELFFHDFYANLMWNLDTKDTIGGGNFKHLEIPWDNKKKYWTAWKTGTTGFPFVDAAIRELLKTGYMNNRCRMVVASTLTLLMNVDWHWGEKFFAQHLVDYDVTNNNLNWQIQAGVGPQSGYLRVPNPWIQGKKFDPESTWIKTWIPELNSVPSGDIHKWDESWENWDVEYPKPILDYKTQKERAIKRFKLAEKYE